MKAMIFAAGLGTRLKPITDRIPKALLPIGGKTLLEWQIDKLRDAGITDITINVHHFADMIEDFCREHNHFGCTLHFSDERENLLETGGGLKKARPYLTSEQREEPILVLNVDILSNIDLKQVIGAYHPSDLAMLVVSRRDTQRYFVFDTDRRLIGWTNIATGERKGPCANPSPLHEEGSGEVLLAFSGMHIVSPRIFDRMEAYPDKFSITDFYLDVCDSEAIRAYVPGEYRMMDIGKIDHLHEAEEFAIGLQGR